jgi:putative oxidoreductase
MAPLIDPPSLLNRSARVLLCLMVVGSALVISGWRSRLGAILLLVFLVPTTLLFHGDVADRMERIQLFKNLALLVLLVPDQDSRG